MVHDGSVLQSPKLTNYVMTLNATLITVVPWWKTAVLGIIDSWMLELDRPNYKINICSFTFFSPYVLENFDLMVFERNTIADLEYDL